MRIAYRRADLAVVRCATRLAPMPVRKDCARRRRAPGGAGAGPGQAHAVSGPADPDPKRRAYFGPEDSTGTLASGGASAVATSAGTMAPRLKSPTFWTLTARGLEAKRRTSPWAGAPAAVHRGAVLRGRRSPRSHTPPPPAPHSAGAAGPPRSSRDGPPARDVASQAHAATSNRPCAGGPSTVRSPPSCCANSATRACGPRRLSAPPAGAVGLSTKRAAPGPTAAPDRRSRGAPPPGARPP